MSSDAAAMQKSQAATLPELGQIRDAAARIAPYARITPVWRHAALDALTGAELHFKCENLQRGGAFKFRGACNAVWALRDDEAARGVVTHSSGNHGYALALAANTRGIAAHVVVPDGAVRSKWEAIERAGAILHRCAPTLAAREQTTTRLQQQTGAILVHPYADREVIAGQGTLALELLRQAEGLDALITPIGGGGLTAGVAIAAHGLDPTLRLFAAEPEGANDAALSVRAGAPVTLAAPTTVCDGLRATIGVRNLAALRTHAVEVMQVSDAESVTAMQWLWRELKVLVEVSSATVLAALFKYKQAFAGRRIGVVLSGSNVDLEQLPW